MGPYDAIVVGARVAGAPTAWQLAGRGHRVLLVDRATFPSDTISTHLIHPPGVSALRTWGLLDTLRATSCPAIHTYAFDMGPFVIVGSPGLDDSPVSYAPRRTVLDKILVDEAVRAGVEVREAFTVDELLVEDGRVAGIRGHGKGAAPVVERARVVIGADGLHSLVAQAVTADAYREQPALQAGYYTYWSGLPTNGHFEAYDRGDRVWAAWPTNDDLTLVVVSWPYAQFEVNRQDVERHYLEGFERAPGFAARVRAARREDRFYGMAVPNFFRKPYGPGWALVGDAGYNKDFITAQGISDAFRDSTLCAAAIDDWLSGSRAFDAAMSDYQSARDAHVSALYDFTCQFAKLAPPTPEMQQLMGAIHGNAEAMNGFIRIISGVVSPAAFFAPENVGGIFAAAARRAPPA